ncbi:MAG: hypothetical protein QGI86_04385 [Candidatus Poribacteria bacterium]|nr:hypothetical protein [Candidatus Poribacteria bacterium]MDP6745757.1 hypothetical protein [Candidatus Poribacteria bacterium]MDP6996120.1 hypothetical protein [Candidatus Poribacteria bacterium]
MRHSKPRYHEPIRFRDVSPDVEVLEIGTLEVISIAPERGPDLIFTKEARKNYNHIVVALGCTSAGFDLAMTAIESSITRAVHIFNGMNGIASPPSRSFRGGAVKR